MGDFKPKMTKKNHLSFLKENRLTNKKLKENEGRI